MIPSDMPIRILLAERSAAFARAAEIFLRRQVNIKVVGVTSEEEAPQAALTLQPHIVLIDPTNLKTLTHLRQVIPAEVRIIVLTLLSSSNGEYRRAILAAGADEVVAKSSLTSDLLPAIYRLVNSPHTPPDS